MRPDLKSKQAFRPRTVFALTCTLTYTMAKTPDQAILRPESHDSPIKASTGVTTLQKSQKR